MSKEILLNFNTIFWVTINKNKNYSYVTRLKSRIYQASIKKADKKMQKLQLKLLTSFASKSIVIDYILKNNSITSFNTINDLEKLCIIYNIKASSNYSLPQCCYYYLNNIKYILLDGIGNVIELTNYFLLLLILEPQWMAKRTFIDIPFVILVNPYQLFKLLQSSKIQSRSNQIYCTNINSRSFIYDISNNYILARLNLGKTINLQLKKFFTHYLYKNNSRKLDLSNLHFDNFFTKLPLECYLGLNIFFYLCIESLFIYNSKLFNSYNLFIHKEIQIYSYGLEIMICHFKNPGLNLWSRLLYQLIYYYICNIKSLYLTRSIELSNSIDFCNYSIILTKNQVNRFFPNKLAQFNLLLEIKSIIIKYRGNSASDLITMLNSVIGHWGNYFKHTNKYKIFVLIDYLLYLKVWRWSSRKHNTWGNNKIKGKYFIVVTLHFLHRKYTGWLFNDFIINEDNKKLIFLLKLTLLVNFLTR